MSDIIVPINSPSDRQKLFLKAKQKYVAFGGARGGGKSWCVRTKATLLAARYNGIKIMIVRRTYPELRQNHITTMCNELYDVARYKTSDKELTFINGSVICFRYCRNIADLGKFQGQQCDILFVDEATQFTEEMFDMIKACVRGVNDFPKRIYLTCNPGGVGHAWVKRLFIDRAYRSGECAEDYYFIKSLVTDNKALMEKDPDYIRKLQALPPKLRRAWLEGDWDIFDGQFFEEFTDDPDHYEDRKYTHVIEPFEVPRDWTIYRSFDWGYSKPFSCDWWAIDYEGRAYLILQLYGCKTDINGTVLANEGVKWSDREVFAEVHRIEKEHRWLKGKQIHGIADPAIWAENGGDPIIRAADLNQVHFYKADNTRIPGWMQCHYRLRFDPEGKPMVYFFNTCHHAIRTLPLLQFDDHRAEDLDTTGEDHFADSFRYFCMARPVKPEKIEEEKPREISPLDSKLGIAQTFFGEGSTMKEPLTKQGFKEALNKIWTEYDMFGKIVFSSSASDKLYRAIMSKDEKRYEQVTQTMLRKGKDGDAIESAIVTGLKKNDERVIKAAQAKINRDIEEYEKLLNDIISDGFAKEFAIRAINSARDELLKTDNSAAGNATAPEHDKGEDHVSIYDNEDMKMALSDGDTEFAQEVIDDIYINKYNKYIDEGKSEKDAKADARSSIKQSLSSEYKPLYVSGTEKDRQYIEDLLTNLYVDGEALYDADSFEKWQ